MTDLKAFSARIQRNRGKEASIQDSLRKLTEERDRQQDEASSLELAQVFIQSVAKETQEQLSIHIQDIVQLALDSCFPGEYEFQVVFEIKRGKTEAGLWFKKEGHLIDPMNASGGGVVDIAAFALRIAAWTLGKSANTIVLDEPFRFLSKDLQPKAGAIMKELSEKLGIQFIMVTHNPDIIEASHRVFTVSLEEGESRIKAKDL